jgi:hypothetical protein
MLGGFSSVKNPALEPPAAKIHTHFRAGVTLGIYLAKLFCALSWNIGAHFISAEGASGAASIPVR